MSATMAGLARFTVNETLEMLLGEGLQEIDSGDESDRGRSRISFSTRV